MLNRKAKRKAATKAKAMAMAATRRAWMRCEKGLVINQATYRGRVSYSMGKKAN